MLSVSVPLVMFFVGSVEMHREGPGVIYICCTALHFVFNSVYSIMLQNPRKQMGRIKLTRNEK